MDELVVPLSVTEVEEPKYEDDRDTDVNGAEVRDVCSNEFVEPSEEMTV